MIDGFGILNDSGDSLLRRGLREQKTRAGSRLMVKRIGTRLHIGENSDSLLNLLKAGGI